MAGTVLEVSRLYEAALTGSVLTGSVLSKLDTGEVVTSELAYKYARILRDCVGYRQGYHSSPYWAPVERKHDALKVIAEMARQSAAHSGPAQLA